MGGCLVGNTMRKEMLVKDSDYWDIRLSWASTVFFIGSACNASLKTILPLSDFLWGAMSVATGIMILLIYSISFKEMLRRSSFIFWRIIILFLFLYILSAVLVTIQGEPVIGMIKGSAFLTFAWFIPTGIFACSVKDKEVLYRIWFQASLYISGLVLLSFFFYIPPEDDNGTEYNMTYGYNIMLPLLIQANEYTRRKKMWLLLFVLFEIFTVLIYANRGTLLSLIFFVVYKFAFESDNLARKFFSVVFLLLVTIFMLSSIQSIALFAVDVLDIFGLESRTLVMLASGMADDTTGREEIWAMCFNMIEEKPIVGWGLGGEFTHLSLLIAGRYELGQITAFSPHNGIIQNFVNFGIVGGFISTLIIVLPLFHLKKYKNIYLHDMLLVFFSAGVIPECISASGFFTTPSVAVALFLFYFGGKNQHRFQSIGQVK